MPNAPSSKNVRDPGTPPLGSRVIERPLRRHLQTDDARDTLGSAAFMGPCDSPQGLSVSLAWRQFGSDLDALLEWGLIERDRVVEDARAFFERVAGRSDTGGQILAGAPAPP